MNRESKIEARLRAAEAWSHDCGNRPLDWSEGMYPQKHLGRDLSYLLEENRRLRGALEKSCLCSEKPSVEAMTFDYEARAKEP